MIAPGPSGLDVKLLELAKRLVGRNKIRTRGSAQMSYRIDTDSNDNPLGSTRDRPAVLRVPRTG